MEMSTNRQEAANGVVGCCAKIEVGGGASSMGIPDAEAVRGETGLMGECESAMRRARFGPPGSRNPFGGCVDRAETGEGEDRKDVSSSVEVFEELSPTKAGGSLSGCASADVMCTGDSDRRSALSSSASFSR